MRSITFEALPVIQLRCLGQMGRFGNQLFQYAFARGYCDKFGYELRTPAWIGQKVFQDINEPLVLAQKFPQVQEGQGTLPLFRGGRPNIEPTGYFQHPEYLKYYTKEQARQWFSWKPEILENFQKPKDFCIACHLRHGDYKSAYSDLFCVIEQEAYIKAVEAAGYDPSDIVWVSEENPRPSEYLDGIANWLNDFLTIQHADVIFRANSTFSWWAATLSEAKIYSPRVDGIKGVTADVNFEEGNHCRMNDFSFHEDLRLV